LGGEKRTAFTKKQRFVSAQDWSQAWYFGIFFVFKLVSAGNYALLLRF